MYMSELYSTIEWVILAFLQDCDVKIEVEIMCINRKALYLAITAQPAGPEPAILNWYGHCMHLNVNKLGGCGGMLPQENFLNQPLWDHFWGHV